MTPSFFVVFCSMVATVGISQVFVRAEGGPGAYLRDKILSPLLERIGLRALANCPFCACVWVGLVVGTLAMVLPVVVYFLACVFGGPAMLWFAREAPMRDGMACGAKKATPTPAPVNANPAPATEPEKS